MHYCIILVASLKKVYSCILGRVVTIRLIIKKDKTVVAKKNCNNVFFLLASYLNILTFKS